jgi:hypothetical protein
MNIKLGVFLFFGLSCTAQCAISDIVLPLSRAMLYVGAETGIDKLYQWGVVQTCTVMQKTGLKGYQAALVSCVVLFPALYYSYVFLETSLCPQSELVADGPSTSSDNLSNVDPEQ